ncbi:3-methyl-2-oxobutanoate hydroxymethyltransferase [Halodesulfurarchaeum formicicum]|uniref:3-methyl-2-oxobutanoate hydroxymethyltransferase n=1 Tax=Halodesulfurarchaeum formicicum TaxID=1873524 RepID=A0A1J1ABR4_9EURY|nr:3-methyl-2-oxobutanoate hydroxymethyltransferase [Halodesulfurarchaeum formicicum]APE95017.1 3-methyl-2-oxobutanoate hydroxymethyltransferase [Halodesulfurarchaeum formicicum]
MSGIATIRTDTRDAPITMLTAADAPTAKIIEESGIDVILVGDSLGNTLLGYDSTIPVTQDEMESHTAAVVRGTETVPVVADVPFLSYGADRAESVRNCGRFIKEAGADAVKLESGPHTVSLTDRLTDMGIPVMAHVGTRPQHARQAGGLGQTGGSESEADAIVSLAEAHEAAGAFAVVVEHVPDDVGRAVTEALSVPTIGIGAGPATDGQVLVLADVLGLSESVPPFAEQFGEVRREMRAAIEGYQDAVTRGDFPRE